MAIRTNTLNKKLVAYFKHKNIQYSKAVKTKKEGKKWIESKKQELNLAQGVLGN